METLLGRLREVIPMLDRRRRDPDVARQVAESADDLRTNGRLLREIRGLQGELERARPSKKQHQGAAPWGSNKPSSG